MRHALCTGRHEPRTEQKGLAIRNPQSAIRNWGVYLVTDRKQTGGRDLVEVLSQALRAGIRAIQLREKDLDTLEVYRLGERLLSLTRPAGAALIVNDRVDVAMALGADGVQLTRKSLPPKEARALVGPGVLLGVSCHSLPDVGEAVEGGADFVVLGPIYATPSKSPYGPPLGVDVLRHASAVCPLPIVAIGGVNALRVPEVIGAGADGVAVISSVLAAPDPAAAASEILTAVRSRRRAPGV
jgi:thiamine-phosphate pyrophosphorylase